MPFAREGYGLLPIPQVSAEALEQFSCGKQNLDEFVRLHAANMHARRFAFTNLVFHEDYKGALAYFTLVNDEIPLNESEKLDLGEAEHITLDKFPAVKIARLAVCAGQQSQGVGADVMDLIAGEILDSSSLSAARLLVVDAENDERVVRFYEKMGFAKSLWAEKQRAHHGGNRRPPTVKMIRDLLAMPRV